MNETPAAIPLPVAVADEIAQAASVLEGVSDALVYRASAEGDEMLAMLSGITDAQLEIIRRVIR